MDVVITPAESQPAAGAQTAAPALPSPADRPEADVVIYDGDCGFCRAQVNKLLWWDCQHKLSYISLHDPEVARRWPDLDHDRLMREMLIIDRQGNRHWGPEAIAYLTRRLRRLWWAAPLFYIPGVMFLWRRMYRWIARNRYRISQKMGHETCDSGACQLHFK
jgi:predicted DCC family thiol-disulfide oxidoreductase YuxK